MGNVRCRTSLQTAVCMIAAMTDVYVQHTQIAWTHTKEELRCLHAFKSRHQCFKPLPAQTSES